VKTELTSMEATLRKHDEKVRLAPASRGPRRRPRPALSAPWSRSGRAIGGAPGVGWCRRAPLSASHPRHECKERRTATPPSPASPCELGRARSGLSAATPGRRADNYHSRGE
jgi:hypothetical protein